MNDRLDMNSGIYCILNLANGKHYIGSSQNIARRRSKHFLMLARGEHHSIILQRAWNKYGEGNFRVDILEYCEVDELLTREQFYINETRPFYNIYRVAGSPRGHVHSEETRAKFREAQARRSSDIHKKISAGNIGKVRTMESIEKYREAYRRKSEEEKAKQTASLSTARRGVPVSEEGKSRIVEKNKREFIVTSPDGERAVIQNLTAFCKNNGLDRTCMTRVSIGLCSHHKGWICTNPRIDKGENNEQFCI
jgi:group I intron endonuclease